MASYKYGKMIEGVTMWQLMLLIVGLTIALIGGIVVTYVVKDEDKCFRWLKALLIVGGTLCMLSVTYDLWHDSCIW